MKKKILFFASLMLMVLGLSTLTSCDKDSKFSITMSAASAIIYQSNVSSEVKQQITEANGHIDNRLAEIFGKTFDVECDEDGKAYDKASLDKRTDRAKKDSKINEEVTKLKALKTLDGTPAVLGIKIGYYSGTKVFEEYPWEF